MSKEDKNDDKSDKNDDKGNAYYAVLGRRIEAEQKAAAEQAKQEAAQKAEDDRLRKLIIDALEADRQRQMFEGKKKADRALQVGIVGAAIFGSIAFITTLLEDDSP